MRLPADMSNLLAVTVRDVIWYRDAVYAFLRDCDLPADVLQLAGRLRDEKMPTIKLIHRVLGELDGLGDPGWLAAKRMLTKMHYWKDVHTIDADRKSQALRSLGELRAACDKYLHQIEKDERNVREEQERRMHEERLARGRISDLDHTRLQQFRDEFDHVYGMSDPQERGNRFEQLINKIFSYYSERSEGSFRRKGEQVDGLFYFDKHHYYVEIRWRKEKTNAADVSVLRDRASAGFGGDTKALFVSFEGFTKECLDSLHGRTEERVVLLDGADLRLVLDCQIALDVLLAEKQLDMVKTGRPFKSGHEILRERQEKSTT